MLFVEFFAEASVVETTNLFAKHIRIPGLMKPIIARVINKKHKTKTPNKADLEKWKNELSSKGFSLSEYVPGYPFFIFKFEKKLTNCYQTDSKRTSTHKALTHYWD